MDRFVPRPDFAERHQLEIAAPPEAVWRAWEGMSITDPPSAVRVLFTARDLIARARHGHGQADLPGMFIPLAEQPPREIVEGIVGRWWGLGAHRNNTDITGPDEFLAFAEPGYAKAAIGMRFTAAGEGRTLAVTETRVLCVDAAARRAMGRYWLLIRPFSGMVRIAMLRSLRKRATQ
jgi:hypothetical protein